METSFRPSRVQPVMISGKVWCGNRPSCKTCNFILEKKGLPVELTCWSWLRLEEYHQGGCFGTGMYRSSRKIPHYIAKTKKKADKPLVHKSNFLILVRTIVQHKEAHHFPRYSSSKSYLDPRNGRHKISNVFVMFQKD